MLKNRLIGLIISGFKRTVFKINIILKFKKLVFSETYCIFARIK